jgi:aspartate ammonia-lyase
LNVLTADLRKLVAAFRQKGAEFRDVIKMGARNYKMLCP